MWQPKGCSKEQWLENMGMCNATEYQVRKRQVKLMKEMLSAVMNMTLEVSDANFEKKILKIQCQYVHEAYFEISTPLDKNSSRSQNKNNISARLKQQSKYNFIQTKCFVIDNVMQVEMYQK